MVIAFHGIEVQEEHTQLVTSERTWEKILRMYCAAKRVENCPKELLKVTVDALFSFSHRSTRK